MKELKKMNDKDLKALLAEKREEVRQFRFGMAGGATRNTNAAGNARREIARIMTELTIRNKANETTVAS